MTLYLDHDRRRQLGMLCTSMPPKGPGGWVWITLKYFLIALEVTKNSIGNVAVDA